MELGLIDAMNKRGERQSRTSSEYCGPEKYAPTQNIVYDSVRLRRVSFIWFGWMMGIAGAISVFLAELGWIKLQHPRRSS